jgi:alpha-tubulin suppressor-like RCC1 family protein
MAIDFSALEQIGANLQRIVSGQNHVVAITEEGALYVWGRNDMGQLG